MWCGPAPGQRSGFPEESAGVVIDANCADAAAPTATMIANTASIVVVFIVLNGNQYYIDIYGEINDKYPKLVTFSNRRFFTSSLPICGNP